MAFFAKTWQCIFESIVDNQKKITATGGFLLGIIACLGFKDFYPDLERAYYRNTRQHRRIVRSSLGKPERLSLEDHENDLERIPTSTASNAYEIREGVDGLIGNTPLIKLRALSEATGCEILAKAEFLNGAGNSPKDRVALSMINYAEEAGLLEPGRGDVVYEGTVGSTGISLAAVCRARGYKAHMYVVFLHGIVPKESGSDISTDACLQTYQQTKATSCSN